MADPRPLFYVTALVVFGLLVFVVSVLLRPWPRWSQPAQHVTPAPIPEADHAAEADQAGEAEQARAAEQAGAAVSGKPGGTKNTP